VSGKDWSQDDRVLGLENHGVRVRIEQETIHLLAMDAPYSDPVELTTTAARSLAAVLLEMADQCDEP